MNFRDKQPKSNCFSKQDFEKYDDIFADWDISEDILSESSNGISIVKINDSSHKMMNSALSQKKSNKNGNNSNRDWKLNNQRIKPRKPRLIKCKASSLTEQKTPLKHQLKTGNNISGFKPLPLNGEIRDLLQQMIQKKKRNSSNPNYRGSWFPLQENNTFVTVEDIMSPNSEE